MNFWNVCPTFPLLLYFLHHRIFSKNINCFYNLCFHKCFYICKIFYHVMKPKHAFQEWAVHLSRWWRAVCLWDLTGVSPNWIPLKHKEHVSPYPSQLPPAVRGKKAEVIWAGFWFFLFGYWGSSVSNINNFVLYKLCIHNQVYYVVMIKTSLHHNIIIIMSLKIDRTEGWNGKLIWRPYKTGSKSQVFVMLFKAVSAQLHFIIS